MICDPQRWGGACGDASLVSRIKADIGALCGDEVLGTGENVTELARAVDEFLQQGGDTIDASHLMLLVSRALSALGERRAAQRLLLMGTGLVRPSEWTVTGADAAWVIDLKQMTVRADTALEMVFFPALNMVLDSIGELWDASSGKGSLGLRHVCRTAGALLGDGGQDAAAEALADEIVGACRGKFAQIGAARQWQQVPQVVNLDL